MADKGILDTLATHDFLSALPEPYQMMLLSGAQPFFFQAGDIIAREGDSATKFFLVQKGRMELLTSNPRQDLATVQTVGPGEVVGWSWLTPPHRWQFQCRAATDAEGLMFDGEWLREKCEQNHELAYHLLRKLLAVVAGRLTATRTGWLEKV